MGNALRPANLAVRELEYPSPISIHQPECEKTPPSRNRDILSAPRAERHWRRLQIAAHSKMPKRLARLRIQCDQIAIVIGREHQPACRRNRPRPHQRRTGHRKLPSQLAGLHVQRAQIELALLTSNQRMTRAAESAIRSRLLRGTEISLALLQRHHKEQPQI